MTALEQVSERYESAKRAVFEAEATGTFSDAQLAVLRATRDAWAHALAILQSQRGNFVG